uniref:Uncharacterized protein n=1 Tax=Rhizophora mucronata TaxID=61149 RepID=A0A2P2QW19_RHIMU
MLYSGSFRSFSLSPYIFLFFSILLFIFLLIFFPFLQVVFGVCPLFLSLENLLYTCYDGILTKSTLLFFL